MTNRVVFTPAGIEGEVEDGCTVLDAARKLGVDIDSVCGGRGICGRCQVIPTKGSFPKWGLEVLEESLSPFGSVEETYAGKRPLGEGNRLGCTAVILGDVVVDVPESSQIHKQVVRKEVDLDGLTIDPVTELRYIELDGVAPPVLLLRVGLARDWDIGEVEIPDRVAIEIAKTVEALPSGFSNSTGSEVEAQAIGVTVAIRQVRDGLPQVAALWPGFIDVFYGVAIDIGSTTIAGHLCDLATGEVLASSGRMNPQIRFGEDLMSRVSYVMMNPGGEEELTSAVRTALDDLVGELVGEAGISRDKILEMTMVGNPVMHHLLLGYDTVPLGTAPFVLETDKAVNISASELDIDCVNAAVYIAPCIAGHVGADTAAAIVAERPHHSENIQLLVDVGTNAEIVLGNNSGLFAASSPTGPAFEGAQLSSGVRAAVGAIERVRIDPLTFLPSYRVIGVDAWSNEPGFEPPATGIIGICGSGVIEVLAEMASTGILDRKGVIRSGSMIGAAAEASGRIVADERTFAYILVPGSSPVAGSKRRAQAELRITQNDVRAIQLAKAALKAGIDLLMQHAELTEVDDIRLAGAFGAHIDPEAAIAIDLIPASAGTVTSPGNSAGTGALRLLLSGAERSEIETVVGLVTKIETAMEPAFQELFVRAMAFPTAPESLERPKADRGRRRRRPA